MKITLLRNKNLNQIIARIVSIALLIIAIAAGFYFGFYGETYWVGVLAFLFVLLGGAFFVGIISLVLGIPFIIGAFLNGLLALIPKHRNAWIWISLAFTVMFGSLSLMWLVSIYQAPPEISIKLIKVSMSYWLLSFYVMFIGLGLLFLSQMGNKIKDLENNAQEVKTRAEGTEIALVNAITRAKTAERKVAEWESKLRNTENKSPYIHPDRIEELRKISSQKFDLTRLLELCEELNDNYINENFLVVPMLTRVIIDHVPPIFGYKIFNEIANNYGEQQSSKSFRKSMQNLQNSLRNIADSSIHSTIRAKETLPNSIQVDFSKDLDVLLAEIIRLLTMPSG